MTIASKICLGVCSIGCFGYVTCYSQVENPKIIQPSPNAAALGKYADIPVGYFTGVPDISVPIYEVKEGGITLPITLNYHASGIRVSEIASWVGLGWSLNAGGAITRSMQHVPDEGPIHYHNWPNGTDGLNLTPPSEFESRTGYYKDGYQLPSDLSFPNLPCGSHQLWSDDPSDFPRYAKWMDAAAGNLDCEPDVFFFNVAGYSGKFLFKVEENESGQLVRMPVFIPRSDIKVDVDFATINVPAHGNGTESRLTFRGFTLTTPDGFKYTFGGEGAIEYSGTESYNQASYEFSDYVEYLPTSWYLTKIQSPDGKFITLEYTPDKYSFFDLAPEKCWGGTEYLDAGNQMIMKTSINGVRLSRIVSTNEQILFDANTTREDLSDYEGVGGTEEIDNVTTRRLDRIEIDRITGEPVKKFDFDYEYFDCLDSRMPKFIEDYPSIKAYFTSDKKRLKLIGLTEKSGDESVAQPPYRFAYKETDDIGQPLELPRRISYQQDHWGYYNGKSGNKSLIAFSNDPSDPRYSDRASDGYFMQAGVLTSITYPLGGVRSFEYEANQAQMNISDDISNATTNYAASVSLFSSDPSYVITPFQVMRSIPDPGSPCYLSGFNCDDYYVNVTITDGDPRLSQNLYDLDFTPYEGTALAAIYEQGNTTPLYSFFIGDLLNANCSACFNPGDCGYQGNPPCSYQYNAYYKSISRNNYEVELPPGAYYLKALRIDGPKINDPSRNVLYTASISLRLAAVNDPDYVLPSHTEVDEVGGLRVKAIHTKSSPESDDQIRTFGYPVPGTLFSQPTYYYELKYTTEQPPCQLDEFPGFTFNQIFASSSIQPMQDAQGYHVGYSNVTDGRPGDGYTEYTFDVAWHTYNLLADPYFTGNSSNYTSANRYYNYPPYPAPHSYEHGNLLSEEIFSEEGVPLQLTENAYEIGNASCGLHATKAEFVSGGPHEVWPAHTNYPIFSGISRIISKTTTQYDLTGHNPVSVTTDYTYGSSAHLQLTETKETLSGIQKIERMVYPPDYGDIPSDAGGVRNLVNMNLIDQPIEKYEITQNTDGSNAEVTGGTITTFKTDRPLPDQVEILELGSPLPLTQFSPSNGTPSSFNPDVHYKDRMSYDTYDSYGNLLEVSKTDDAHIAYLWNYNGTLPVAEIKNATAGQVYYNSFEDELTHFSLNAVTGKKSYNTSFVVSPPSSGTFNLTYWKKVGSNAWQLIQTQISSPQTIGGSNILIDEVRVFPVGAQMTTYTYDVAYGVTSATDENNITTYFEYDSMGRLATVKDQSGNITKSYAYHYGN